MGWENYFNLLVEYKEREGHCNVSRSHKEDGENLGQWLSDQRKLQKKEKLDPEKEKQMEMIGVVWDVLNQQWENSFNLLVNCKKREGHCNVPNKHKQNGETLGEWLSTQRKLQNKENLDPEKQKWLEDLGVVWDVL